MKHVLGMVAGTKINSSLPQIYNLMRQREIYTNNTGKQTGVLLATLPCTWWLYIWSFISMIKIILKKYILLV